MKLQGKISLFTLGGNVNFPATIENIKKLVRSKVGDSPLIPALEMQKLVTCEFKSTLGYIGIYKTTYIT